MVSGRYLFLMILLCKKYVIIEKKIKIFFIFINPNSLIARFTIIKIFESLCEKIMYKQIPSNMRVL